MKLNNKGFAISTVMYMILIMAVILITLTLSILSGRKLILDSETKEAKNNIYNVYDISYRQALEILKNEAIAYAQDNNIEKDSIKIGDFNSSIDNEILDGYKLTEKYLTIISTGDSYDIYLGKSKTITDISKTVNNLIDIVDYKISGNSYQKTYTGKNLFDFTKGTFTSSQSTMEKTNDGGYNITNLETTSSVAYNYSSLELSSGTYTASVKGLSGLGNNGYMQIVIDGNWSSTIDDNKSYTFTLTENKTIRVYISFSENQWTTGGVIYPQIEEGTIATSYEPYVGGEPSPNPEYPQDVQSVGEYDSTTGKYKIPVTVSGLNLGNFPKESTLESVAGETRNYIPVGAQNKILFDHNKQYIIKFDYEVLENIDVDYYVGNAIGPRANSISYEAFTQTYSTIYKAGSTDTKGTFEWIVTPRGDRKFEEYPYLTLGIMVGYKGYQQKATNNGSIKIANVYLYEYQENMNYDINEEYFEPVTTYIYLDEPLRKINESIDTINFSTKKINRNINEEIFDENTTYTYSSTYFVNRVVAHRPKTDYISKPDVQVGNFSTHFSPSALRVQYLSSHARQAFGFPVSDNFSTVDDLKNLLTNEYNQGTPITVYYPLSTSVESTIDLPKLDIGIGNYKIEIGTNIKPSSVEFTVIQKIKQI